MGSDSTHKIALLPLLIWRTGWGWGPLRGQLGTAEEPQQSPASRSTERASPLSHLLFAQGLQLLSL